MTPRKFQALLRVHWDFIKAQNSYNPKKGTTAKEGFIDNLPGW